MATTEAAVAISPILTSAPNEPKFHLSHVTKNATVIFRDWCVIVARDRETRGSPAVSDTLRPACFSFRKRTRSDFSRVRDTGRARSG